MNSRGLAISDHRVPSCVHGFGFVHDNDEDCGWVKTVGDAGLSESGREGPLHRPGILFTSRRNAIRTQTHLGGLGVPYHSVSIDRLLHLVGLRGRVWKAFRVKPFFAFSFSGCGTREGETNAGKKEKKKKGRHPSGPSGRGLRDISSCDSRGLRYISSIVDLLLLPIIAGKLVRWSRSSWRITRHDEKVPEVPGRPNT